MRQREGGRKKRRERERSLERMGRVESGEKKMGDVRKEELRKHGEGGAQRKENGRR